MAAEGGADGRRPLSGSREWTRGGERGGRGGYRGGYRGKNFDPSYNKNKFGGVAGSNGAVKNDNNSVEGNLDQKQPLIRLEQHAPNFANNDAGENTPKPAVN